MDPFEASYRETMKRVLKRFGYTPEFLSRLSTDKLDRLCQSFCTDENEPPPSPEAAKYAQMIDPQRESYKETSMRLSQAIGKPIDAALFHQAVRLVRYKFCRKETIL